MIKYTMVQMIDLEEALNIDQVQLCRVIMRIDQCIQHVGDTAESINTPLQTYTLFSLSPPHSGNSALPKVPTQHPSSRSTPMRPVRTLRDERVRCRACRCRPRRACAALLGRQLLPRLWLGKRASVPSDSRPCIP